MGIVSGIPSRWHDFLQQHTSRRLHRCALQHSRFRRICRQWYLLRVVPRASCQQHAGLCRLGLHHTGRYRPEESYLCGVLQRVRYDKRVEGVHAALRAGQESHTRVIFREENGVKVLMDDFKVYYEKTAVGSPNVLRHLFYTGTSFRPRWNKVEGATKYYVNVYKSDEELNPLLT